MLKFRFYASALVLSAVTMASGANRAFAQSPSWNPNEQVELTTGYYARGDFSLSREKAPSLASDGSLAFGSKSLNSWALSFGAGNKFNNWFRADVTFDLRGGARSTSTTGPFACITDVAGVTSQAIPEIPATATTPAVPAVPATPKGYTAINSQCNVLESASLSRMSGLANFYLDLGSFAGVSPYVGVGLGMTTLKTEGSYDWRLAGDGAKYKPTLTRPADFPLVWVDAQGNALSPQPDISWGAQDKLKQVGQRIYNATWAVMAGVAIDVGSHAKVDLGYRFINFGKVATSSAPSGGISTAHELKVGIRYMID